MLHPLLRNRKAVAKPDKRPLTSRSRTLDQHRPTLDQHRPTEGRDPILLGQSQGSRGHPARESTATWDPVEAKAAESWPSDKFMAVTHPGFGATYPHHLASIPPAPGNVPDTQTRGTPRSPRAPGPAELYPRAPSPSRAGQTSTPSYSRRRRHPFQTLPRGRRDPWRPPLPCWGQKRRPRGSRARVPETRTPRVSSAPAAAAPGLRGPRSTDWAAAGKQPGNRFKRSSAGVPHVTCPPRSPPAACAAAHASLVP